MIVLWLVRCSETNISSSTATSDSRMISASKGSILLLTAISLNPRLDDQVADPIQASALAGVDHSGGGVLFDDGGAPHVLVEAQSRALKERRLVNSILVEVDFPPAFGRRTLAWARGERGQVGIRDPDQARQMQVDELDRSVETKHEGALVALVEAGCHLAELGLPVGHRDAHRVLLAGVTHVGRADGHHVCGIEALVLEEQER